MDDEDAWAEYSGNRAVLKALHVYQCEVRDGLSSNGMVTPPVSPTKK
jgi:histone acetyltransferase HTATIP